MRKNVGLLVLIAVFVMFSVQNAQAWGKKKTAAPEVKETQKEVKQEKVEVITEKKVIEQKEVKLPIQEKQVIKANKEKDATIKSDVKLSREKVRLKLDNTSWDTEIFPIAGGGKIQKEALVFSDNKFYAEQFKQNGFMSTNYTLTLKDDGMIIWETMQSADDGQVIFWRGEMNEDMTEMRGVLSKQKSPGESESFTFISKEKMPVTK
ncbi:MAG: hypothetical protein KJ915_08315 [Candidatus Omnitrophica bacterium]|nr:hypothetical protein [Candidatus Omnitrophota bacterium]